MRSVDGPPLVFSVHQYFHRQCRVKGIPTLSAELEKRYDAAELDATTWLRVAHAPSGDHMALAKGGPPVLAEAPVGQRLLVAGRERWESAFLREVREHPTFGQVTKVEFEERDCITGMQFPYHEPKGGRESTLPDPKPSYRYSSGTLEVVESVVGRTRGS